MPYGELNAVIAACARRAQTGPHGGGRAGRQVHGAVRHAAVRLARCAAGAQTARGGQSERFGVAIALFFLYYMLMRLGRTLAERGLLNAVCAMAIPDVVFLGLAVWMFLPQRDRHFDQGRAPGDLIWTSSSATATRRPHETAPAALAHARPFPWRPFSGPFFVCLAAFTAAYLLGDIFDRFDDLMRYGGFGCSAWSTSR